MTPHPAPRSTASSPARIAAKSRAATDQGKAVAIAWLDDFQPVFRSSSTVSSSLTRRTTFSVPLPLTPSPCLLACRTTIPLPSIAAKKAKDASVSHLPILKGSGSKTNSTPVHPREEVDPPQDMIHRVYFRAFAVYRCIPPGIIFFPRTTASSVRLSLSGGFCSAHTEEHQRFPLVFVLPVFLSPVMGKGGEILPERRRQDQTVGKNLVWQGALPDFFTTDSAGTTRPWTGPFCFSSTTAPLCEVNTSGVFSRQQVSLLFQVGGGHDQVFQVHDFGIPRVREKLFRYSLYLFC